MTVVSHFSQSCLQNQIQCYFAKLVRSTTLNIAHLTVVVKFRHLLTNKF